MDGKRALLRNLVAHHHSIALDARIMPMERGWELELERNRSTFCLKTGRTEILLLKATKAKFLKHPILGGAFETFEKY